MIRCIRNVMLCVSVLALLPGTALAFVLGGYQWDSAQTSFNMNLVHNGSSSPSGTSWHNAFVEAANAWNSSSNFSFSTTAASANPCNDLSTGPIESNAVVFASSYCGDPWEFGVLAVTVTWFNTNDNSAVESDMMFNSLENWDVYHGAWGASVADFRRVAVHELGHALGLDHEPVNPAIMMAEIAPGSTIETPTSDDVNGAAALYGPVTDPGDPVDPIKLALEEPATGSIKSGVANLRGWVVTQAGLNRVELFIDGKLVGNIPSGGPRGDVANAFPDYPDSGQSGFSMIRNYSNLSAGQHTARVVAYDQLGRSVEQSVTFNTVRFDKAFISDPALVSLSGSQVSFDGDSFYVQGMSAEGKLYDVTLRWSTATQNYQIISISPH